ncbi:hypothetical protein QQ045_021791 [Rhodiola kirilowii]
MVPLSDIWTLNMCLFKSDASSACLFFDKLLILAQQIELPHWTDIVKTAIFKELAPYEPDWYYIRAASMARKIYCKSKRNGSRPPHFCKSSGSIARHILQQLHRTRTLLMLIPRG